MNAQTERRDLTLYRWLPGRCPDADRDQRAFLLPTDAGNIQTAFSGAPPALSSWDAHPGPLVALGR